MARILGLDLGAYSIKALLLDSSFRGYTVRSYAEVKRTEEGGLRGALSELKALHPFNADQVIVAVPGVSLTLQTLNLPFSDPRKIEAIIGPEFENLLPCDLDEVVYDYQLLDPRGEKGVALIGSARREEVGALLADLQASGLDPRIITSNSITYQNLFAHASPSPLGGDARVSTPPPPPQPAPVPPSAAMPLPSEPSPHLEDVLSLKPLAPPPLEPEPTIVPRPLESELASTIAPAAPLPPLAREPTPTAPVEPPPSPEPEHAPTLVPAPTPPDGLEAIVDLGHTRTALCIAHGKGPLLYARTFSGGGLQLTRAIAQEFQVSPVDAEAWKETEGAIRVDDPLTPDLKRSIDALRRGFAPLLRELRTTLRSQLLQTQRPVTRLWLTGGTSRLPGLAEYLAEELGLEVHRLHALPRDPLSSEAVSERQEPSALQAFALALRGHGTARASERFDLRKGPFTFQGNLDYLQGKLSRIALYAVGLVALAIIASVVHFRNLSKREDRLDAVMCELTQKTFGTCQKNYLTALAQLKGKDSASSRLPSTSALDLLSDLTSRAQEIQTTFEQVDINLDKISIRGHANGFEDVDQLVDSLKKSPCFQDIKRGGVKKSKDGSKVDFDLDIHTTCDQSPEGA